MQAVNDAHAGQAQQQARLFPPATGSTGIPPFFPNPGYQPGLAGLTVADQQHWLSRLRGGPRGIHDRVLPHRQDRAAAGRRAPCRVDDRPRHPRAWRWSPAARARGKSALLALPVLLTEQSRRADLLRAAEARFAHSAHRRPAPCRHACHRGPRPWAEHRPGRRRDRRMRWAGQAEHRLRAAGGPRHRAATATAGSWSSTLSTRPPLPPRCSAACWSRWHASRACRVVVGARRHVLSAVGEADLTIDLDASDYHDPQALTDYVHRLLIASEEPGVTTCLHSLVPAALEANAGEAAAAAVAAAIARTRDRPRRRIGVVSHRPPAGTCPRVAAPNQPMSPAKAGNRSCRPAWLRPSTRTWPASDARQPLARALLTALAWARGSRLAVGEHLGSRSPGPGRRQRHRRASPRSATRTCGGCSARPVPTSWRTSDQADGRCTGRSMTCSPPTCAVSPGTEHEGRDPAAAGAWQQRRARTEQVILPALCSPPCRPAGTARDWRSAHPYLRTYLAQHAAAAGADALPALVQDADFLAAADPVTLSPLLSFTVPELRDTARIYRRARPLLGDDLRANAAYLQEAAGALTGTATEDTGIRPLYRTHLASVRRDDSLLTLTGHTGGVTSVAFGDRPGRAAAAGLRQRRRDGAAVGPGHRRPVGTPLTGHMGQVTSVAFGTGPDGRLLLASGSRGSDGTVRVWDPVTGAPASPHRPHGRREVGGVRDCPGRAAAAGLRQPATARCGYGTGLPAHPVGSRSPATRAGDLGGVRDRPGRAAAAGLRQRHDGTVRVWDPVTGAPVGEPAHRPHGRGDVGGVRDRPGRAAAPGLRGGASTGRCGSGTRSPAHPSPKCRSTGHPPRVASVAFGTGPDGRLLLASGSDDGTVRVWDPVTGAPAGEPLTGHTGGVTRWRSGPARTGGCCWPPAAATGRCGCGTRSPAPRRRARSPATRAM